MISLVLENVLEGVEVIQEKILRVIKQFYKENLIDSPGVLPEDLTRALVPE